VATDLQAIVESLTGFHDFADRALVAVGAGGGQLLAYARPARRVIAVDHDAAALARLATRAGELGMGDRMEALHADFLAVRPAGDVVVLEFCLHQMAEPAPALDHARELAPDVVVIDHAPGSPWSWLAAEDEAVRRGWAAVAARSPRRQQDVEGWQRFRDHAELEARLAAQGALSRERVAAWRGGEPLAIAMPYRLALL
jgi:hypothetical protein